MGQPFLFPNFLDSFWDSEALHQDLFHKLIARLKVKAAGTQRDHWAQCEECGTWRQVSYSTRKKIEAEKRCRWSCSSLEDDRGPLGCEAELTRAEAIATEENFDFYRTEKDRKSDKKDKGGKAIGAKRKRGHVHPTVPPLAPKGSEIEVLFDSTKDAVKHVERRNPTKLYLHETGKGGHSRNWLCKASPSCMFLLFLTKRKVGNGKWNIDSRSNLRHNCGTQDVSL